MKKQLLFFCSLLISLAAWATEPEAVNIHRFDGTITSTMFDDFQNLELSGDVIIVYQQSGNQITIAMDNVANILWGDYVSSTPTDIENICSTSLQVYHNGTQCVIRSDNAILHFVVFDTLGRFIYSESLTSETNEVLFPTDSWTTGIYLVFVETTAGKTSAKIIL